MNQPTITLNGRERQLSHDSLAKLVAELQLPDNAVAIAVNDAVIPSSAISETHLNHGDHVEVIRATAGG